MSSSSHGDETRRTLAAAVINDWTVWLKQVGRGAPPQGDLSSLAGLIFEAFEIIDDPEAHGSDPALRADPVRAVEEMRERCAQEAERCVKVQFTYTGGCKGYRVPLSPRVPREIAAAIRALPIQPAAEGGAE